MVEPITTTLIGGGILLATTVIGGSVLIWSTKKQGKISQRSIKEAKRQRKLTEKSLESQETMFKTNTILTVIGIIVGLVGIGFAIYRFTRK